MVAAKLPARPDPLHYVAAASLLLIFLAAVWHYFTDPLDRNHCQSLLTEGWWLDSKFKNWQPAGCMMQTYKPSDATRCLADSHVLFIGDSIVRGQLLAMVKKLDSNITIEGEPHSDRLFQVSPGISFEFWWDPFLNTSHTLELLQGTAQTRPSLLVIGSGLWYLAHAQESGGASAWRKTIDRVVSQISNPALAAKIASTILLAPVETPEISSLSPIRRSLLSPSAIASMNDHLLTYSRSVAIPFAWNRMVEQSPSQTDDGLHYNDLVISKQMDILLNFKCNDYLPKQSPMGTTCCYRYPRTQWYQNTVFLFFLAWVPLGIYLRSADLRVRLLILSSSLTRLISQLSRRRRRRSRRNSDTGLFASASRLANRFFPSEPVLIALFTFGLGVLYMFFGDRTQIFGKAQKQFSPWEFGSMLILTLAVGLSTLKHPKRDPALSDGGFLNREQTDEWKGWMQLVILIYHYWGASSISGIYNPVRVLVAAYLFQTGYGHFFFFYKKGDFGLARVVSVLVRLNLLTVALEYAIGNDYLSYYFTPLVSFWFLVIWVTMYVANKYNKTPWVLGLKLVVACAFTNWLIYYPGVLEQVFAALELVANVHWNTKEWRFRLGLDAYIVYVGMIVAYACIRFKELKIAEYIIWPSIKRYSILAAAATMIWYFWFELTCKNKFVYNDYHPFISWLPILAFTFLRNATPRIRNTTSNFFVFFGGCSLETFIGQFHMWLAGDTKGLLVLITPASWTNGLGWWANFAISSAIFVWVCWGLAWSTGVICDWICGTSGKKRGGDGGGTPASSSTATTNDAAHASGDATVAPAAAAAAGSEQGIPLLPTSSVEVSMAGPQQHRHGAGEVAANGTVVEMGQEEGRKEEMEEEGQAPRVVTSQWGLLFDRAWADLRLKVVVWVVMLVIVNRWC